MAQLDWRGYWSAPSPQVCELKKINYVVCGDNSYPMAPISRSSGILPGFTDLRKRVAVNDYDPALEHLGYGAADFVMMPSRFEPCGLPQMIGAIYGALPNAHKVGGLRDTVRHLNPEQHTENGFLFKTYGSGGLFWAIQQATSFYHLPAHARSRQISRIMAEGAETFNHEVTARHYIDLYQKLLRHPVIERMTEEE